MSESVPTGGTRARKRQDGGGPEPDGVVTDGGIPPATGTTKMRRGTRRRATQKTTTPFLYPAQNGRVSSRPKPGRGT